MAALDSGPVLPSVKIENAPSPQVNDEIAEEDTFQHSQQNPDEEDVFEDAGDLDFSNAQQQLWLSRVPRSLWEIWSKMPDDGDIEIGTVRVEGSMTEPKRISLKLDSLPQFEKQAKEYQLLPSRREKLLGRRPRNAFVFTEKDLPGYKRRDANRDNSEVSNFHSRSYLYEKNKRDVKKKMSKKRFEPYIRRTLPKQTAIVGAVSRELECTPVEDDEYRELERQKAEQMLKPKEEPQISFNQLKGATYLQPGGVESWVQTKSSKQEQRKKEAAKDNRALRLPKNELIDMLLDLFQYYRYWGLRELKRRTNQPEVYLREVLSEMAILWKSGDLNGKWELKPEFKEQDTLTIAEGMAPEAADSDADLGEDDDENQTFEDV